MRYILTLFSFMIMCNCSSQAPTVAWINAAQFQGENAKFGYAGMAAVKTSEGFLIAGGANFPKGLPWENGSKVYSDAVFLWQGDQDAPKKLELRLPEPLGYAGYAEYDNNLIIAGGESAEGISKKVYKISSSSLSELPELPLAVTAPATLEKDGVLYLAGGDEIDHTSKHLFSLDLKKPTEGWKKLADLPYGTANAAIFYVKGKIYLLGGRSKNPNGISTLHDDILVYNVKTNTWTKEGKILIDKAESPFTAPAYFVYDNRYLVLAGGDDGKIFHQIEKFISEIKDASDENEKEFLNEKKAYLVKHHQGFTNKVIIYDTDDKTWVPSQYLPFPAQVTTASVVDGNHFYIFSGEVRPGVRSPKILKGSIEK